MAWLSPINCARVSGKKEYLKQRKTRYVNSLCPVLVRSVAVGPGVLITVVGSVGQVRRPVKRHSTADV